MLVAKDISGFQVRPLSRRSGGYEILPLTGSSVASEYTTREDGYLMPKSTETRTEAEALDAANDQIDYLINRRSKDAEQAEVEDQWMRSVQAVKMREREQRKQRDEEQERQRLMAENQQPRNIDVSGLMRSGDLADQRHED